jgi:uncharacterized protein YbjQ (UPF0145 family)
MELLIQLLIFLTLLVIGLLFGRSAERRHFGELARRERELKDILVFNERRIPEDPPLGHGTLVTGSVVIAEDYFKRIACALRSFFGGRLSEYESLMDRGRREAILRMKEVARSQGATMIFNVRVETSTLGGDGSGSALFSAEFLAYGTALKPAALA